MIIRIPLDDTNSRVTYRFPTLSEAKSAIQMQADADGSFDSSVSRSSDSLKVSDEFNQLTAALIPSSIPAYKSSHYSYPVVNINVTVPDDDKAVVASWFGNSSGSSHASDTLVKRMTTVVLGAINTFYTDASRIGLFTRPFKLGYALISSDSVIVASGETVVITPNDRAPVMTIRNPEPNGNQLNTLTEIRNTPCELRVSLPPFTIPDEWKSKVTELIFYTTDQTSPLTGNEQVTGVRTFAIETGNCPGWYYPRLSSDLVKEKTLEDSAFRIIGRVPIARAVTGLNDYRLPDERLDLNEFKSYPEIKDVPSGGNSGNTEQPVTPLPVGMDVQTFALDLGLPEKEKRVRAVTARGIFSRHPDNVSVVLYGAHHQPADTLLGSSISSGNSAAEDAGAWHRIAKSRGPHIRLLRGVRYRWLKVEISTPWPARIDALTFTIC
ncbi:MAG: hypothetical protein HDS12_05710 [Bacteroides sp.]|nr:hypothetical protein [Bacteroides sp.]